MKLKFDASLDYQLEAINTTISVLRGQSRENSTSLTETGLSNTLALDDTALLENVQALQEKNGIPRTGELKGRNFSIEMETGTGKTYVYLRTIFELEKLYGFKKFIIVVPSIAIREGVLKSLSIMKEHFNALYSNVPFDYFVYDSSRLGKVRQFAGGNAIQLMIINIQSFQKDIGDKEFSDLSDEELKKLNVIHRENDKLSGRKPIEFIQNACPIVIIDEPQSVDTTDKSKRAIANLNPLFTLRYSATHKHPYNLIYKLDPLKAFELELVKRIEVASVRSSGAFNDAYVQLLKLDNKKGIKAHVAFHKDLADGAKLEKQWIKLGDDLHSLSGGREAYANGFKVQEIDCTPNQEFISFSGGLRLTLGEESGGHNDDILKAQIFETVEQHFKKERAYKSHNIKVLSLFFIDKVANYRIYHADGSTALGKIGLWFEEAFQHFSKLYQGVIPFDVGQVHSGYFSQDKKGVVKDSSGKTADDESTYALIMRDKERLLDMNEPLRFIFSHTALKEGWDNPNVFQICTLREVGSEMERRQQIGRGLRLPVNASGERVRDVNINRLTVIASESYKDFANALQKEFENECGIAFGKIQPIAFSSFVGEAGQPIGQALSQEIWEELKAGGYLSEKGEILAFFNPENPHFRLNISPKFEGFAPLIIDEIKKYVFENRVVDERKKAKVTFQKQVYLSEDFQELWNKIKHKTRYRVTFSTNDLIARVVQRLKNQPAIETPRIEIAHVQVDVAKAGVIADKMIGSRVRGVSQGDYIPNLLAVLQEKTDLTRSALLSMLNGSGKLHEFKRNPQAFITMVLRDIQTAMNELIIEGIKYERIENQYWEMHLIEEHGAKDLSSYIKSLYPVQNITKSLYDHIEFDSSYERQFAQDLDTHENVKLFVKLPKWFKIETPIGHYNPDWAFVTQRDEKLYFVRETKHTRNLNELFLSEQNKIKCGSAHFKAIGVDYDVVSSLQEVSF